MKGAVASALAVLLAACSEQATVNDGRAAESVVSSSEGPPPPAAAPAGNLKAEVSSLNADRSDLSVRVTDLGTIVDLPSDALFDYDRAVLTPAAEAELRKVAALIGRSPPGPIQVVGHSDDRGEEAYNQRLSEERARVVADWFKAQVGVRQRTITSSGKGETAPIAPNRTPGGADDPEGRERNRRVEVVLPSA